VCRARARASACSADADSSRSRAPISRLEPAPALADAVGQVVGHARAVRGEQPVEVLAGVPPRRGRRRATGTEPDGEPGHRTGIRAGEQVGEIEPAPRPQAGLRRQLGREPVHRRLARCPEAREKAVGQLHEPIGGTAVELLGPGLGVLQPRLHELAGDAPRPLHRPVAQRPPWTPVPNREALRDPAGGLRVGARKEGAPLGGQRLGQPRLLGGEQRPQVRECPLGVGHGQAEAGQPALRLVQRPDQRVAVLVEDPQEALDQPGETPLGGGAHEAGARLASERLELALEQGPVPRRFPRERGGGADLEQSLDRTAQALPQDALGEHARFLELPARQPVRLVDDEDEPGGLGGHVLDERQLLARDGGLRPEDDQRSVDVGHELLRQPGVAGEDRAEARRVHQAHPGGQERAGQEDLHRLDALAVTGIPLFGDVGGQQDRVDRLPRAARHPHPGTPSRPVAEHGHDRRHRHHARRQDGIADQGVEERRLAALELTDAGDEEASLGETLGQRAGLGDDVLGTEVAGDRRQLA
jgi:hypothetical protein